MENIMKVTDLEKSYKDNKAVKGINFNVKCGEILGFLGPNGAGKSTTINILSTALKADKGEVEFCGKNVQSNIMWVKRNIGVVPQDLAIYEELSAEKNIRFFASLYGIKGAKLNEVVKEALEFVGLYDKRKDKAKTFSGGMKRRLNIACAIAHKPKLIIMDEPTVGIDPQSRNHILQSIKKLRSGGATIIYTTHYMEEVEEIADRVIIMDNGQIIADGTKEELKREIENERVYDIEVRNSEKLNRDEFFKVEGVKNVVVSEEKVKVRSLNTVENLDKLILLIVEKGCKIQNITTSIASLEMVFLNLTGKSLRD